LPNRKASQVITDVFSFGAGVWVRFLAVHQTQSCVQFVAVEIMFKKRFLDGNKAQR